jgi:hypothetical protein
MSIFVVFWVERSLRVILRYPPKIDTSKLKDIVVTRLLVSLGVEYLEDVGIPNWSVDKLNILWNLEHVNPKTGIVKSEDENNPKPSKLAMQYIKTLAGFQINNAIYATMANDVYSKVKSYFHENSIKNGPLIPHGFYEMFTTILTIIETEDTSLYSGSPSSNSIDKKVLEAFQLSFLLIPPENRRQLHMLLKLMDRMVSNHTNLVSIVPTTDREDMKMFLVSEFWSVIINSPTRHDLEEMLGNRFVHILLENYDNMFKPQKDHLLAQLNLIQQNDRDMSAARTYCKKMSMDQYELEKRLPKTDLVILLDHILENRHYTKSEKKKKLMQFRSTYPSIYLQKFSDVSFDPLMNGEIASLDGQSVSSASSTKQLLKNLFK